MAKTPAESHAEIAGKGLGVLVVRLAAVGMWDWAIGRADRSWGVLGDLRKQAKH